MNELSPAQLQERKDAARARWAKVGVIVGTGLAVVAGGTASRMVRKRILRNTFKRIDSKLEAVLQRKQANTDNRYGRLSEKTDAVFDKAKKKAMANPGAVIGSRLKQLDLFINHEEQEIASRKEAGLVGDNKVRLPYSKIDPLTGNVHYASNSEVYQAFDRHLTEQEKLKTVKLPDKTRVPISVRRKPGESKDIAPSVPVSPYNRNNRVGRLKPAELKQLRDTLNRNAETRKEAAKKSILYAMMGERAANARQMDTIYAKLRRLHDKRYRRGKRTDITAALVSGAVAGSAIHEATLKKSDDSTNNPTFATKIQSAFQNLRDQAQELIHNVANNSTAFNLDHWQDKIKTALEPLGNYYNRGVAMGVKSERPKTVAVRFDLLQPSIFRHLGDRREALVKDLTDEQRDLIHNIVTMGISKGTSPSAMARSLRNSIGLTQYQSQIIENYRDELVTLKPAALQRALRDKRFDSTLANAIKSSKPLTNDQINKMTAAYSRRFLAMRCNTIARDQSLAAINLGHISTIKEVASSHGLGVEKTWVATKDSHTREAHLELDGQTVMGADTPFNSELGPIKYPYDPQAKPANTIQCRCHLKFRLFPMNQIRDVTPENINA